MHLIFNFYLSFYFKLENSQSDRERRDILNLFRVRIIGSHLICTWSCFNFGYCDILSEYFAITILNSWFCATNRKVQRSQHFLINSELCEKCTASRERGVVCWAGYPHNSPLPLPLPSFFCSLGQIFVYVISSLGILN